ncbi:MAG: 30S ribosomal protein S8 [Deltaproteobacteria bacterium]|nr:30S ribosomal protein S8 [Deltaproteobacteria bacterium]
MMTDPIADLLTRIRNGIHARHESVSVPASKVKEQVLKILKETGYIASYIRVSDKPQDRLTVFLKYRSDRKPVIREVSRVSRPGRRVYRGHLEIKPFLRGMGLTILSTSKGILTDAQARKKKVGGEVLCQVW